MRSSVAVSALLLTQQFATIHGFLVPTVDVSQSTASALYFQPLDQQQTGPPVDGGGIRVDAPGEEMVEVVDGEDKKPRKRPLSPAELVKKYGSDVEEAPKLFEEYIYDDLQNILLTLEKRAKEGPGSLSMLEVEEFVAMADRVTVEMKGFDADGGSPSSTTPTQKQPVVEAVTTQPAPAAVVPATPTPPPAPVAIASQPADVAAETQSIHVEAAAQQPATPEVQDTSEDEGPAYDGTGGMGQPRGTVNTYIIPGMDEMSPDEYLDALQKSVSARHDERRRSGKNYGNRQTWDYLNNLTGESGQLKEDE